MERVMFYTIMPYYEVFFDQDANLITMIHEDDGSFREEYETPLLNHFGIGVRQFEMPYELSEKIEKHFTNNDLAREPDESLEDAVVRIYVRPFLLEFLKEQK
jgi:hypothetical protein